MTNDYIIAEDTDALQFFGGAADFWAYKGPETILTGPYETGKTIAALSKLHLLLCLFPKSRALMVRKTQKSVIGSAVVSYEQKVLPVPPTHRKSAIKLYGGEKPEFYDYPNGSRLIVGGMDNPDKFLSAEYDFVYINQAEELELDDFEKVTGRATGRAGNAPWTQVMGDCNPGAPNHWIKNRERLKLFESRHEDNPRLWDRDKGEWTEAGKKSIETLDALTGLRYKRGRLGLWVSSEGVVYEFDSTVHLINRFDIPASWQRIRVIDFGLVNPFVCLWFAIDNDGRMYLYRELYMTQRTVARHMVDIHIRSVGETYTVNISDHDAEDRATLKAGTIIGDPAQVERLKQAGFSADSAGNVKLPGIVTVAADKRVTVGIEKVQERLKLQTDGKPRLFVMRDSLIEVDKELKDKYKPYRTEDEFGVYAYAEGKDGKPDKDEPLKIYDHGMDATRYGVLYFDGKQKRRDADQYKA